MPLHGFPRHFATNMIKGALESTSFVRCPTINLKLVSKPAHQSLKEKFPCEIANKKKDTNRLNIDTESDKETLH